MNALDHLTPDEERLRSAVQAGEACTSDVRSLRAEVIRALCVRAWPDMNVDPKGIQLVGARIAGILDLEAVTLAFPLRLRGCEIEGEMRLGGATLHLLDLRGTCVAGGLDARNLKVSTDVLLAEDPGSSHGRCPVKHFTAKGEVCLSNAEIGGTLDCSGAALDNPDGTALNAQNITVRNNVFLCGDFRAKGRVNLINCEICGNLDCGGGEFQNPEGQKGVLRKGALYAEGAAIGGNVFLRDGFKAYGQVNFINAKIGGNLDCRNGRFENRGDDALAADRSTIGGGVFLTRNLESISPRTPPEAAGFVAMGEIRFLNARVEGDVSAVGATFDNTEQSPARFSLEGAQVEGRFLWLDVKIQRTHVDLRHARAARVEDEAKSWPSTSYLRLDGFAYDAFAGSAPVTAAERLRWLALQPETEFRPQPYEQLVGVLRRLGHDRDARDVAVAKQKKMREVAKRNKTGEWWPGHRILEIVVGYGYRPWRAAGFALAFLVIGTVAFLAAERYGHVGPAKEGAYVTTPGAGGSSRSLRADYPPFFAPIYSLDVLLPIVNLHQEEYWLPTTQTTLGWGWAVWAYMWVHILAGWSLTTLLVAALTGLIKRD